MSDNLQPPDLHMGDVNLSTTITTTETPPADHVCCPCTTTSNRTPTPRTHSTHSSLLSLPRRSLSPTSSTPHHRVYIVVDTCYPTAVDFNTNKGSCRIDSVHSSKRAANARAKKIIFQTGSCKVDVDKIIEEIDEGRGLYTGIGIGGSGDGTVGTCYARKCGVEGKVVDEGKRDVFFFLFVWFCFSLA